MQIPQAIYFLEWDLYPRSYDILQLGMLTSWIQQNHRLKGKFLLFCPQENFRRSDFWKWESLQKQHRNCFVQKAKTKKQKLKILSHIVQELWCEKKEIIIENLREKTFDENKPPRGNP